MTSKIARKLKELDDELSEGDITQKGYDKKKEKLMAMYDEALKNEGGSNRTSRASISSSEMVAPTINVVKEDDNVHDSFRASVTCDRTDASYGPPPLEIIPPSPSPSPSPLSQSTPADGPSSADDPPPMDGPPSPPHCAPPWSLATGGGFLTKEMKLTLTTNRRNNFLPVVESLIVDAPKQANSLTSDRLAACRKSLEVAIKSGGGVDQAKKNLRQRSRVFDDEDSDSVDTSKMGPLQNTIVMSKLVSDPSSQEKLTHFPDIVQWRSELHEKSIVFSVTDDKGKERDSITYGKLASRVKKLAYVLTERLGIHPGDRVALVFSYDEFLLFVVALLGCMHAGVVAMPLDPPRHDDESMTAFKFLLNGCGAQVALTSENMKRLLPHDSNGHIGSKGWPQLTWHATDQLKYVATNKRPSVVRLSGIATAYTEHVISSNGEVKGVDFTYAAISEHCRALQEVVGYSSFHTTVSVLSPVSGVGLWHGIFATVFSGMHAVFIPRHASMSNPMLWPIVSSRLKTTTVLLSYYLLHACLKVHTDKDKKSIKSLESVHNVIVEPINVRMDNRIADLMYKVLGPYGLPRNALCLTQGVAETATMTFRKKNSEHASIFLDLEAVRDDRVVTVPPSSTNRMNVIDQGEFLPGLTIAIISPNTRRMAEVGHVGEICVSGKFTGSEYYGLSGLSKRCFRMHPINKSDVESSSDFVRSGLIGFVDEKTKLVYVVGNLSERIYYENVVLYSSEIGRSITAIIPTLIYRNRIAVFSVEVLKEERVVVVCEVDTEAVDHKHTTLRQWISNNENKFQIFCQSVLNNILLHTTCHVYQMILVRSNSLPRDRVGNVQSLNVRKAYLKFFLDPVFVLLNPTLSVTNLVTTNCSAPNENQRKLADILMGAQSASVTSGGTTDNIDEVSGTDMGRFKTICEILLWRASTSPNQVIYSLLSKSGKPKSVTCTELQRMIFNVANMIKEKVGLNAGDHAILLYSPSLDLVVAFYACMFIGVIPIAVRPYRSELKVSNMLNTVAAIAKHSQSRAILSDDNICHILRSKFVATHSKTHSMNLPHSYSTENAPKYKSELKCYRPPTNELTAFLEYSVSAYGVLTGVIYTHDSILNHARAEKAFNVLSSNNTVAVCIEPYSGMGCAFWLFVGVYSGFNTMLISPWLLDEHPALWLQTLSSQHIKTTLTSYPVIATTLNHLTDIEMLRRNGVSLSSVENVIVEAPERTRADLIMLFSAQYGPLGLSASAIASGFGCFANTAVTMRGPIREEPTSLFLDLNALRKDRVNIVKRGHPNSICIHDSGRLLPHIKLALSNIDDASLCNDQQVGELWVSSSHNARGFYGNDEESKEVFQASFPSDKNTLYVKTGYLGFHKHNDKTNQNEVFVVGNMDDTFSLNGYRYYPTDIEESVEHCHRRVRPQGAVVFAEENGFVTVVAELLPESEDVGSVGGPGSSVLNIVWAIANALIDEHSLIAHVIALVKLNTIPIDPSGHKRRNFIRNSFLVGNVKSEYIAYSV